jgi:FlaG/FlaF family flagellin (archaellin)
MLSQVIKKNKKGLSAVIGYVLLIAVSIVISAMVYQFLKTYVPKDSVECAEGVSLFMESVSCTNGALSITVKNNGKFGIDGYFIHISNTAGQNLATIDISDNVTTGGYDTGQAISFSPPASTAINTLSPEELHNTQTTTFAVVRSRRIYTIEIIPTRQEIIGNVKRFASCGNAKIEENGVFC